MRVVEYFASRQGEGLWTGTPSTFIRLGGCNLFCRFCDTAYASWKCEPGIDLSPEEIVGIAVLYGLPHVVLTGGEPMAFPAVVRLTKLLAERNFTVTIETNGTYDLPVFCSLMSISPKMKNSVPTDPFLRDRHESLRYRPDVVRSLLRRYSGQLKFVVDTPEDLIEIDSYLAELGRFDPNRVFLMPQAVTLNEMRRKEEWIRHSCQVRGFKYAPRMQLEWYGAARGK